MKIPRIAAEIQPCNKMHFIIALSLSCDGSREWGLTGKDFHENPLNRIRDTT